MSEQSVIHSTFVIERNYPKSVERVFTAFADSGKKRRWYAEGDAHEIEHFEMDFKVGGKELMRYRFKEHAVLAGQVLTNEGWYQEILPEQRIVTASVMSLGEKRISASLVTIELLPAAQGTDLICTHQGAFFEGSGGPQMREVGWRTLFDHLGVELAQA